MSENTAIAERSAEYLPAEQPKRRPPTMLDIIERAAFDPRVDADKVAKLVDMARTVRADDAKAAYIKAMIRMKPELPIIERKGRIIIHEKGMAKTDANIIQATPYARWEDIDEAITPILNKHGFTLTHRTGFLPDGKVTVTAIVSHKLGHSEESTMAMPLDTSGSKNNVQAVGSSISYGKRYTASALLNLRTKDEDDDGKAGGDPGIITEEQAERLLEMLERDKASVPLFCKSMAIESLIELPATRYEEAITRINTRSAKLAAQKGKTQ
ncbi:ERF family protein [uncultured Devosia sp.]|uniref:ERF family protein n=1 Tax=uncultured Devosia sp. TaxID=211434 RepID=UPI002618665A|nr:ERF family protein [uncultured Devosia sp.]